MTVCRGPFVACGPGSHFQNSGHVQVVMMSFENKRLIEPPAKTCEVSCERKYFFYYMMPHLRESVN